MEFEDSEEQDVQLSSTERAFLVQFTYFIFTYVMQCLPVSILDENFILFNFVGCSFLLKKLQAKDLPGQLSSKAQALVEALEGKVCL